MLFTPVDPPGVDREYRSDPFDTDSDNDDEVEDVEDGEIELNPPGKYVCVNKDDDDHSGEADIDENPVFGEDDLKALHMETDYDPDDPENPRPDAWCSECQELFLECGGEWTDEILQRVGVGLLSGACYDVAKMLNFGR